MHSDVDSFLHVFMGSNLRNNCALLLGSPQVTPLKSMWIKTPLTILLQRFKIHAVFLQCSVICQPTYKYKCQNLRCCSIRLDEYFLNIKFYSFLLQIIKDINSQSCVMTCMKWSTGTFIQKQREYVHGFSGNLYKNYCTCLLDSGFIGIGHSLLVEFYPIFNGFRLAMSINAMNELVNVHIHKRQLGLFQWY